MTASTPESERTLADVVRLDAPLAPGRALALTLSVGHAAAEAERQGRTRALSAEHVVLRADGTVLLLDTESSSDPAPQHDGPFPPGVSGSELGASLGCLLVVLLMGRPAVGRSDAADPVVRAALADRTCALVARSCSDQPGQWPSAQDWVRELNVAAGARAAPLPPALLARRNRHRALVLAATVVLMLAVVMVLVLAPGWWHSTTGSMGAGPWPDGIRLP